MINPETYNWDDLPENIEKAKQIRKNISEAGAVISDAILRYKKKKINARSKKEAADMALAFKDLDVYSSRGEIATAYGWDMITAKERERLLDLWDAREKYVAASGEFRDDITDLLQAAITGLSAPYTVFLAETDEAEALAEKSRREAAWRKAGN